ncbi:Crp/Fnr family transcriptional regulator [Kitasatospora griseola]|uniref:Crp/Fnr family transcriptional regulator n=1 Tax=Kitasatospora griseola TaxID=2064 RepID=UPI0037F95D47
MTYGSHMDGRASFLGTLTAGTRTALEQLGTRRNYVAKEVLIEEGDLSRDLVLLLKGTVKVTRSLDSVGVSLVDIRITGDVVGEIAAMDSGPRSATVTACSDVTAILIAWNDLLPFLQGNCETSMALNQVLVQRLRRSNRLRLEFGTHTVLVRLARVLVELADSYGQPCRAEDEVRIDVGLTQQEFADLTGSREDTVHKALARLRKAKLITTGGRQTHIIRMSTLRCTARSGCLPTDGTCHCPA